MSTEPRPSGSDSRISLRFLTGAARFGDRMSHGVEGLMAVCKRVHFWGTVQGVGFRMATRRIARQHAVTGYVRNLPDGQVELVAAGETDEVERFLGAVATRMAGCIEGHKIQDEPPQLFDGFEIRT